MYHSICLSTCVLDDVDLEPNDLTRCFEEAGLNESIQMHARRSGEVKAGTMTLLWFGGGRRERERDS